MHRARITAEPLQLEEHVAAVADPRAGAVVPFVGRVRDHDADADGPVIELEYSAHPDAEAALDAVARRFAGRDGVLAIAVSHRIGPLRVGDLAIVCAVASAHRDIAFAVGADLVTAIKAEVPIWKRQVTADGSHAWVGVG